MTPLITKNFTPPLALADFKLAAFDMDSTLINIECIDEIAAMAGKGAVVDFDNLSRLRQWMRESLPLL